MINKSSVLDPDLEYFGRLDPDGKKNSDPCSGLVNVLNKIYKKV